MGRWVRSLAIALMAPLLLVGCLFLPGKFEAVLTIHADRAFTYTYKGEVMAIDLEGLVGKAMKGMGQQGKGANGTAEPGGIPDFTLTPEEKAKQDDKFRALAAELAKESGYRTVDYRGNGVFYVDYAVAGTLTHGFVFPYNLDNKLVFPWLAVELRGKDLVRVKAPGFARPDTSGMGMGSSLSSLSSLPVPGAEQAMTGMDGTFTLNTDAVLLSQNNEEGAETVGSVKTVTWHVTSTTPDAPMASVRVSALP